MAEIPDRYTREDTLFARMEEILRPARAAMYRGDPVDWLSVRTSLVQPITDELATTFAIMLLWWWQDDDPALRSTLTNQQAPPVNAVAMLAADYAGRRAQAIASALAESGREVAASFAGGKVPRNESTGIDPARSKTVATTETTAAGQAGEEAGRVDVERRVGRQSEAFWVTRDDDRVCPVCAPLDMTPEAIWRTVAPAGPPAHPNCRCHLRRVFP